MTGPLQKVWLRHLSLLFFTLTVAAMANGSEAPLPTVSSVDLQRYAGKWYEIARYPNWFERNCVSDVTATYSVLPDGKIRVVNACKGKDGKLNESKGKAKSADPRTNAKLKVTFFWPFYGDYWVIDLAPDYSYAVVSEPKREYLWILSRSPQMNQADYDRVIGKIQSLGFDPARLVKPQHSAAARPGN